MILNDLNDIYKLILFYTQIWFHCGKELIFVHLFRGRSRKNKIISLMNNIVLLARHGWTCACGDL
jgi:hypothetical protein